MRAIADGSPTRTEYRDYLAGQLWLHGPLEEALSPWVSQEWRASRLVKTQWLLGDLRAIGHGCRPAPASPLEITSDAVALGTLYVLEGGTLGLQALRKRMIAGGAGPGPASRFMRGYGDATGANWREFVARLEALPQAAWPQALDAASATFAAFQRHFAARPLPAAS